MGRKIEVDIDDMLALFRTYGSGGPMPYDLFEIMGDCHLIDIDEYAKTCGDNDVVDAKEDIIEMFESYIGTKTVAEMREPRGV